MVMARNPVQFQKGLSLIETTGVMERTSSATRRS